MITVITRTYFPPGLSDVMEDLTSRSIPIFKKQPGFINMEVLKAMGGNGTLTVFKWKSITDHENCMSSEDWSALNKEWEDFLGREDVHFEFVFTGRDWM